MSLEDARSFMEKMRTDADFCKSVVDLPDDDRRRAFIQEAGFTFSREEIESVLPEPYGGRLTEVELEAVSGGMSTGDWISYGVTVSVVAASPVVAASV